jgi:hypothetical protein
MEKEKKKKRGGCKDEEERKRGRGQRPKGWGSERGTARVREERGPPDHRMQINGPENSSLNRAPDPAKECRKRSTDSLK